MGLTPNDTTMIPGQHAALDRLADRDPAARVVGWDAALAGPLVRLGDGKVRCMSRLGRLRKVDL